MLEETTAVEPQQQQPGLQEAYSAGHDNNDGDVRKKAREPREAIPAADTLNESEADKQRKLSGRQSPTLEEAFNGVEPEEVAGEIPEELQRFSADDIAAAMNVLGLSPEDLKDPRWLAVLEEQLEASAHSEEEDSDEAETEEEPEKKEPKPPEEQKVPAPVHAELQPEDVKKYVETTWEKAQQINHPVMSQLFEDSLATALDTAPEHREVLHNVCELLSYGGTSLVQSAVPAMVDQYMQANFVPNLMRNFGQLLETHVPGIGQAFNDAQAANTWDAVRSENESFADLPNFESKEFTELRDKIRANNPWIDSWDPDPKMPPLQALKAKAQLFARLAVGERVNPKAIQAQIAEALETGKRNAQQNTRRVSAGRMLGRGRTEGTIGEQRERSGLMDAWNREHGKDGGIV